MALADDIAALDLRGKANDVIRAVDDWSNDADDPKKALDLGDTIAREVTAFAKTWGAGLAALRAATAVVNVPAVADKIKAFADASDALDRAVTVAEVTAGGLASDDDAIRSASTAAAPKALRNMMVGVRDVIRAWEPTVPLVDLASSIVPSLGPILELGRKLGDALVAFAQWLRRAIAGVGFALLALLWLFIDNRR